MNVPTAERWGVVLLTALLTALLASCGGGGPSGSGPSGDGAATTTASLAPLRLLASFPADGASNVDPSAAVTINFDAALGSGVTASQVQLSSGSINVPIAVEMDGWGIVVRPLNRLTLRTDYKVTVKAGTRAANGVALADDLVLGFRTAPFVLQSTTLLPQNTIDFQGNVAAGDVNRDGRPDVVLVVPFSSLGAAGYNSGYSLEIYVQQTDGSLALRQKLRHLAAASGSLTTFGKPVLMDIDGDGQPEILVCQEVSGDDSFSGLQVFKLATDGQFSALPLRQSRFLRKILVVDINGDGRPDLLGSFRNTDSVAESGFQVLLNGGTELLAMRPVLMPPGFNLADIAAGDIDGDGFAEILVGARDVLSNGLMQLRRAIYSRQADGQFALSAPKTQLLEGVCTLLEDGCERARFVDLDGDGRPDLLFNYGSRVSAYFRQPGGGFTAGFKVSTGVGYGPPLQVLDLDNDGQMDFLAFNNTDFNYVVAGFGQRRATLEYSRTYALPQFNLGPTDDPITVVDFDGDGRPDILVNSQVGLVLMRQVK